MVRRRSALFGLILGPALALLVLLFGNLTPGNPLTTRMAAVAIWMAVWWITEAIPLGATALLPVALFPPLGLMAGKAVAPLYFNSIIFLFLGGFMVALAMERWDLHRRIALRIILLVLGGLSRRTHLAVWLVAATVIYAVASRMIYNLVFLRRRMRRAADAKSAPCANGQRQALG